MDIANYLRVSGKRVREVAAEIGVSIREHPTNPNWDEPLSIMDTRRILVRLFELRSIYNRKRDRG